MATELLSDGIRRFAMDTKKLESIILGEVITSLFQETTYSAVHIPFLFIHGKYKVS